MFGLSQNAAKTYNTIDVDTSVVEANPLKLVILLYEGAITACNTAIWHIHRHEIDKKGAALSKAIMIIESGLRISLDKKVGGDIAENLDALYRYMSDRLYIANIRQQEEPVREVVKLLGELKSAWEVIGKH